MRAPVPGLRTAGIAVTGVVVLAVAAVLAAHQPAPPARRTELLLQGDPTQPDLPGPGGGGASLPWWVLVIALGLLFLVASMLWFVFRDGVFLGRGVAGATEEERRRAEIGRRESELAAAADAALADAADDLDAGVDAREVVIACWVRIEAAADEAGLGRRAAETATDVARRWLVHGADPGAVDELAALYHLARYSTHPMTAVHRDRARAALRGALGVTA